MALDQCIVDQCKAAWTGEFVNGIKNRDNCSGFVKAVAKGVGIPLSETANADGLIDEISKFWTAIASGKEAAQQAELGNFIVACLKSDKHRPSRNNGHICIVVAGAMYRDKYPLVWGGSTGSAQSEGTKSVGEVWNRNDRDAVSYWSYSKVACKAA